VSAKACSCAAYTGSRTRTGFACTDDSDNVDCIFLVCLLRVKKDETATGSAANQSMGQSTERAIEEAELSTDRSIERASSGVPYVSATVDKRPSTLRCRQLKRLAELRPWSIAFPMDSLVPTESRVYTCAGNNRYFGSPGTSTTCYRAPCSRRILPFASLLASVRNNVDRIVKTRRALS
jgi:hypothetical protein